MGSWFPNKHRKLQKNRLMLGQDVLAHTNLDKCKTTFSRRDCFPYLCSLMGSKSILENMVVLNDNLLHLKWNKGLRNGMGESPGRCSDADSS